MIKFNKVFLCQIAVAFPVVVASFFGIMGSTKGAAPIVPTVNQQILLDEQKAEINRLRKDLSNLYEDLESDPSFVLREIDHSLDALQRGDQKSIRGSYSDWFEPKIQDLRTMGVSKKRLRRRVNRLVMLAAQGKYLSSYEAELLKSEGINKFRISARAILK